MGQEGPVKQGPAKQGPIRQGPGDIEANLSAYINTMVHTEQAESQIAHKAWVKATCLALFEATCAALQLAEQPCRKVGRITFFLTLHLVTLYSRWSRVS